MASRPPTEPAARSPPAPLKRGALHRVGDVLLRFLLAVVGLFLFILGIQLMRTVAAGVGPILQIVLGQVGEQPLHALAFGWLLAYGVMSGSPVAAFSLGLFDAGFINAETTYMMIMGSRLGASFIVLVIGLVALARGQPREKCLAMGVLSFLVTYSIYLPAILLGWLLLRFGVLDWYTVPTPPYLLDLIAQIFTPFVTLLSGRLPAIAAFLVALVAIYAGLALFDKAFGRREAEELKSPRMHRYLQHPAAAFAIGALITFASTSVSLSLGLLVPLYLHGYIDRRKIVPYIMGANITTFIDTLFASFLVPGGGATEVVLVEMVSVSLVSVVVLALAYGPYSRVILGAAHAISAQPWLLAPFLAVMAAVPLALLFV